jgi:hemolysin-activating ACP:hemolysin acyltransferase
METDDRIYPVAFISFAFRNTSIMKDLQKRGEYIKNENWEGEE